MIRRAFRHIWCGHLVILTLGAILASSPVVLAGTVTGITWTPAQLVSGESTQFVTAGPDGNAWATEQQKGQILKIAPDGTVTRFALPAGTVPGSIGAGPDGNLWFTGQQGTGSSAVSIFGKVTTAGVITIFPYPNPSAFVGTPPYGPIAGSSDGFVYASDVAAAKLGKITPATGAVMEILTTHSPGDIVALPDGSLVVAEPGSGKFVARVVNGAVTQVTIPGGQIPSGVSGCTFGGNPGFCVADSHGFATNFVDECTLGGSCTPYSIDTQQCSAQQIACSGDDCFLATAFCQEVVHLDMSQTPPASNIIAAPAGYNVSEIRILGAAGLSSIGTESLLVDSDSLTSVVAVLLDSLGDYAVFIGSLAISVGPCATFRVSNSKQIEFRDADSFDLGSVTGGTPPYYVSVAGDVPLDAEVRVESEHIEMSEDLIFPPGTYQFTYTVIDSNTPPCSITSSFKLVVHDFRIAVPEKNKSPVVVGGRKRPPT